MMQPNACLVLVLSHAEAVTPLAPLWTSPTFAESSLREGEHSHMGFGHAMELDSSFM